jgi:hypothetical protein
MKTIRLVCSLFAGAAALACGGATSSHMTRGFGPEVVNGFALAQQCFADSHHGAMGFHHVNRGYLDAKVEVQRPEILLYERLPTGDYRLNAIEYIIPYRAWSRDSTPPRIMGLELKRQDALKLWYLHMWLWTENAAGLFADFNPAVKCATPTPMPS